MRQTGEEKRRKEKRDQEREEEEIHTNQTDNLSQRRIHLMPGACWRVGQRMNGWMECLL